MYQSWVVDAWIDGNFDEKLALLLALLPSVVILFLVLRNIRYKKKPLKKLTAVLVVSAFCCFPAIIIEFFGMILFVLILTPIGIDYEGPLYSFLNYLIVIAGSEECCKFFTFRWMIFSDREFDNTYDGVVYGAASALGFATIENLMYVFGSGYGDLKTALLRGVMSIPLHAITGIVMGYYFGIAKYRRYNNIKPKSHPEIFALAFSILLHGSYDYLLSVPDIYKTKESKVIAYMLIGAIIIFIYILTWYTIKRAKKNSHNIYNRYYYEQLDGVLQDMAGGKTTEHRRTFFGVPFGRVNGFDPYHPYIVVVLSRFMHTAETIEDRISAAVSPQRELRCVRRKDL